MKKLSRTAVLASSAATLATSLAGRLVVWPCRPCVWEEFRAGRFVLPPSNLPACDPGTLGEDAKNAMRAYFEDLAQAVGFPGLSPQQFFSVVHEFVSLQYARGGFRALGLSDMAGHFGGPEGSRHRDHLIETL